MIVGWLDEAVRDGARLGSACATVGLSVRTIQRWRARARPGAPGGEDLRAGPKSPPPNRLSDAERAKLLEVANAPENRELSPKQLVPKLADEGSYYASESTFYRVLRENGQNAHRGRTQPPEPRPRAPRDATAPNQVWSWDITWLRTTVRGRFFYAYVIMDIWSRKIVGFEVHEAELGNHAATLFEQTVTREGAAYVDLLVHADNGQTMKAATVMATFDRLGILPSYSRPAVSDDNPYSEALFRTLKYWPRELLAHFETVEDARAALARFVAWYNHEHLHSGIGFVTPHDRHTGRDRAILQNRRHVYAAARARHPERWSGRPRRWEQPAVVRLPHAPSGSRRGDPSRHTSRALRREMEGAAA